SVFQDPQSGIFVPFLSLFQAFIETFQSYESSKSVFCLAADVLVALAIILGLLLLFFISAILSAVFRVSFFLTPVQSMSLDPEKHQKRLRFGVPDYAPEPDL